jgi:hypothetical protein
MCTHQVQDTKYVKNTLIIYVVRELAEFDIQVTACVITECSVAF